MNDSRIEGWTDLLDALGSAQDALKEPKLWYRGHARHLKPEQECEDLKTWKLVPRVYDHCPPITPRGEKWLMSQFMMRAPARYDRYLRNAEYAVWLSLARHYGLWTRLLDWTESILVAAFFAVSDQEEDGRDGAIWVLNPHGLNESECNDRAVAPLFSEPASKIVYAAFGVRDKVEGEIEKEPHDEDRAAGHTGVIQSSTTAITSDTTLIPGDEKEVTRILAAWAPERDLRMLVQQAAYTIHGRRMPLEELDGAVNECNGKPAFLRKYVIPANKKEDLRKQLANVGYTTTRLYPDLQHLAEWLNAEVDGELADRRRRSEIKDIQKVIRMLKRVIDVRFDDDTLSVDLADGLTITVPLAWYPRLLDATSAQRANWQPCGGGFGIHWPEIDEDLSTQGLLAGAPAPRRSPPPRP